MASISGIVRPSDSHANISYTIRPTVVPAAEQQGLTSIISTILIIIRLDSERIYSWNIEGLSHSCGAVPSTWKADSLSPILSQWPQLPFSALPLETLLRLPAQGSHLSLWMMKQIITNSGPARLKMRRPHHITQLLQTTHFGQIFNSRSPLWAWHVGYLEM